MYDAEFYAPDVSCWRAAPPPRPGVYATQMRSSTPTSIPTSGEERLPVGP